jgi:hypothetical protein
LLVRLIYITVARIATGSIRRWMIISSLVGRLDALAVRWRWAGALPIPFIPSGTGPTAWLPPLYPMIIGAVFRVFGIYTPLSGWVLLAINSIFGAATVPAIYEIAQRCFGEDSERGPEDRALVGVDLGVVSGDDAVLGAVDLGDLPNDVSSRLGDGGDAAAAWDRRRSADKPGASGRWGLWIWFGLLWGLIGLSNATPLLLLPVCVVWVIGGVGERRRALAACCVAGVVFVACLAPWTWRNWEVFHTFIPLRGNLGAELWVHNGPEDDGFPRGIVVFSQPDLRSYTSMGEVAYVRERGDWAKAYIRSNPGRFLRLSLERVYWFWMNLPHPLADHPFAEAVREATFGFLSVTGWLGAVARHSAEDSRRVALCGGVCADSGYLLFRDGRGALSASAGAAAGDSDGQSVCFSAEPSFADLATPIAR